MCAIGKRGQVARCYLHANMGRLNSQMPAKLGLVIVKARFGWMATDLKSKPYAPAASAISSFENWRLTASTSFPDY
jgi:hypothetical protein